MNNEQYVSINKHGDKRYYADREMKILHREDGPAIEDAAVGDNSTRAFKSWWINGKLHREDGPAVEYNNGYVSYFLEGKPVSQEEHKQLTSWAFAQEHAPSPAGAGDETGGAA
jgi:hypothetical protein